MAVAAIVAAQNARRKKEECTIYVEGFDSHHASVNEKQAYSECIDTLHPQPMSEQMQDVGKGCVAVLLVAFVTGIIYGWKQDGFEGSCTYAILVPISIACVIFIAVLVFAGLVFLFT